jgi:adenylate kinase family enzyme
VATSPRNTPTPRRIVVVGNSGSGKTTAARAIAERLEITHVELDAVFHQPNWAELPPDEFRARVAERLDAAPEGWVLCGNYSAVREVVWPRVDTVAWLDLPRATVMKRVTARTLRRVFTREELWNGNREPFSNLYAWDPTKNIIRWAWTTHGKYSERYAAAMGDPRWAHLTFVRLCHPAEVDRWIEGLAPASG